jgi:proteasome lid subunit RPN8/RPN11
MMIKTRVVVLGDAAPAIEIKPAPYEQSQLWLPRRGNGTTYEWLEIFMAQDAYQQIDTHAHSALDMEVGGMLVGQVCYTPIGLPYIVIDAPMPARYVKHGPTHLTFTSDTLADALNRIDDQYPDKKIVGWYHTHPGLSVFMSPTDVWLHKNFFREMWQVALVIDPVADHGGFFRYIEDKPGHLQPQTPGGFRELMEPESDNVVRWQNMTAATESWFHQQA